MACKKKKKTSLNAIGLLAGLKTAGVFVAKHPQEVGTAMIVSGNALNWAGKRLITTPRLMAKGKRKKK